MGRNADETAALSSGCFKNEKKIAAHVGSKLPSSLVSLLVNHMAYFERSTQVWTVLRFMGVFFELDDKRKRGKHGEMRQR